MDHSPRTGRFSVCIAIVGFLAAAGLPAQSWDVQAPRLPAPEPFSLNSYDAIQAVLMIRQAPALLRADDDGTRTIVAVASVRSVWIDFNPEAFVNHQNRYDLELNGEPLDWDHLFIEFAGSMVNLRLLFTYRNEHPVPDVRYRAD